MLPTTAANPPAALPAFLAPELAARGLFAGLCFDEPTHAYTLTGQPNAPLVSVTTCLKQFEPVITARDPDAAARKRDAAGRHGDRIHRVAQNVLCGQPLADARAAVMQHAAELPDEPGTRPGVTVGRYMAAARAWFTYAPSFFARYRVLAVEWPVYDAELNLAGTIDVVVEEIATGRVLILDWKTYEYLNERSHWGTHLAPPFGELDHCELVKGALQLATYRLLLWRAGVRTDGARLVHVPGCGLLPCREYDTGGVADGRLGQRLAAHFAANGPAQLLKPRADR